MVLSTSKCLYLLKVSAGEMNEVLFENMRIEVCRVTFLKLYRAREKTPNHSGSDLALPLMS